MPFSSLACADEAFRYVTIMFFCRSGTHGILLLPDYICPEEDDSLSVSKRFRCYLALTYDLSYIDFLSPLSNAQEDDSLSVSKRFGRYLALTYDLSYIDFLSPLSNAQCSSEFLCAAHAGVSQYYGSTNVFRSIPYAQCLEQQSNEKWILPASVWKHLLRMLDVILLFLGQLPVSSDSILIRILIVNGRHGFNIGYDCLYLSRNLSHICISLNLRFRQTLHTKHDFRELKKRLIGRFAYLQGKQSQTLVTFFHNCICWQKRRKFRRFTSRFRFKFNRYIHNGIHLQFLSDVRPMGSSDTGPSCQNEHGPGQRQDRQRTYNLNLGGAASRLFDFSLIGDHLTSSWPRVYVSVC
jgi:hypothetical protein